MMMEQLKKKLLSIDRRGYKAYKGITGNYKFNDYKLFIDYVQGDPFASPSRIRVCVPNSINGFPVEYFDNKTKKIAFCDFLTRVFSQNIYQYYQNPGGTGKSGMLYIDTPSQEVLERTSFKVDEQQLEARLEIGLPASGRRILANNAIKMLFEELPKVVKYSMFYSSIDQNTLKNQIQTVLNQEYIREKMKGEGLCSFIADNSILPRESGISSKPMKAGAVPFKCPDSLKVSFNLPDGTTIKGMGIKEGITLIVGGGFHGKSTLLNAIELGIYNHIPTDGREYVLTRPDAVKIRAEDGRRVEKVDISYFIDNLPGGKDTSAFSTDNASGSTSQAANIVEALDNKTSLLLIDEDTCATNFMFRDHLMKQLVQKEREPISPFIEKAKALHQNNNVSTIMVAGSSGEYFKIANCVIMMDAYRPIDVTDAALKLVKPSWHTNEPYQSSSPRIMIVDSIEETRKGLKVKTRSKDKITVNKTEIDLSFIEQLVERSQLNTIGAVIEWINKQYRSKRKNIVELIDNVYYILQREGLEGISKYYGKHPGNLAFVRKQEILAAINRYRHLKIVKE
ncbi:MAG: ABC-ATPase domain-containing protein [Thermotogota bacterium]|nr:ABC-ATPase domain-containing protein [Thermotogota bacterium]